MRYLITSVVVAVLGVLVYFGITKKDSSPSTPAIVAPAVKNIAKETIETKVDVYKSEAKKTTGLPLPVQQDTEKHVVESTEVPASDHPQTVTTVLDDKTGNVQTFIREEPKLWLDTTTHKEVRLDYGIKYASSPVARLSFREDVFQIKSINFGVSASVDSDGQYFIGVGVGYRW